MTRDSTTVLAPRVVALEPGDRRADDDLYPLLRELRPGLTPESFTRLPAEGHPPLA